MVSIFTFIVILFATLFIGGGGGLLLWYGTRPKKLSWIANVYQVGEGIKSIDKDKLGRPIQPFELKDLIPYIRDILVREDEAEGITFYSLKKLRLTCSAVTADMVENWGKQKEVDVLLDGSTATVMKRGYDAKTGTEVFRPMPRERIELIKSELTIKKNRRQQKKDLLAALALPIMIGFAVFAILGSVFLAVQGWEESNKIRAQIQAESDEAMVLASQNYREGAVAVADAVANLMKGLNLDLPQETEKNIIGKVTNNSSGNEIPESIDPYAQ